MVIADKAFWNQMEESISLKEEHYETSKRHAIISGVAGLIGIVGAVVSQKLQTKYGYSPLLAKGLWAVSILSLLNSGYNIMRAKLNYDSKEKLLDDLGQ